MSLFKNSTYYDDLYGGLRDLGYRIENTRLGGRLIFRLTTPSGRVWITGDEKRTYPMNNHCIHQIADDKRLSYELANRLGLRIPQTVYVDTSMNKKDIVAFLDQYSPVIVKPLDSHKSRGVTLGITSKELLAQSLERARVESPTVIVQEQVRGEEYRFTVLEGKVVSVLRRERPQVIGDGIHPIRQLVARENDLRNLLREKGVDYPEWTGELVGDNVTSEEVLEIGVTRILSNTTLVSRGASVYELLDETDAFYIEAAERFAREIGAGLCAVDMFILDETQPLTQDNYWFNECNTSPSLKMYSVARNADNRWIVEKIIKTMDRYLNINV